MWRKVVDSRAQMNKSGALLKVGDCMFMSEYNHTIDTKGRLIIPSKFRELLGEQFVVTRGLDGCLFAFATDEWKIYEEKLKKLPLTDRNARKFVRFMVGGAAHCDIDKQGRALIPATLREFAKIDKEVILSGMVNRIEIWGKEEYEAVNTFDNMDEIAEQMRINLELDL